MNESMKRTQRLLSAAAGSTLCLGLAVGTGMVPLPAETTNLRTAAASEGPIWASIPPAGTAPITAPVEATPTTETTIPAAAAAVAAKKVSVRSKVAPVPNQAPRTSEAELAPVTAVEEAKPALAARRQPSSAEVQAAIQGLGKFVKSIFAPSPAQIAEGGDKICTAFDQGQTFTQIKATTLQMVAKLPFTSVLPGADDYVVRSAVKLYCPGYESRLV